MKLLETLKITPNQEKLYQTALTHTSYANENKVESYERLEYLGDAVLELIMSEYLYKNTSFEEGIMTKMRAKYVCEDANYEYSLRLGLNDHLQLGNGELANGGSTRKAIIADVFEAFIGAMFLDLGIEYTKQFLYEHIIPLIEHHSITFDTDYKSILQELVQTDKRSLEYVVTLETGPAHHREFTVIAKIDDIVYGKGIAYSKKEAEQKAAKDALQKAQTKEDKI